MAWLGGLGYVEPSHAVHDLTHRAGRYFKVLSKLFVSRSLLSHRPHGANLFGVEYRQAVFSAAWCASVSVAVASVIYFGSPSQVFQAVVCFVIVYVAGFHTFWGRTNKREQHQPVDLEASRFVVACGQDDFCPAPLVGVWAKYSRSVPYVAADVALIGRFVAFVARYRFPRLCHTAQGKAHD